MPSRTAHHHLEAAARTVPGGVLPLIIIRALRVRIAAVVVVIATPSIGLLPAFAPFARGRGGSVESTGSLSRGAAVEVHIGANLVVLVTANVWVGHVLGLVVERECEDPDELTCLTIPVEVEEGLLAAVGLAVDVNVGSIGAARPAEQSMHMLLARAVSQQQQQQQQQRAYHEVVSCI
eukprot:COSAG05_NODE_193_length_14574_cov_23.070812_15_plen_178_part_00